MQTRPTTTGIIISIKFFELDLMVFDLTRVVEGGEVVVVDIPIVAIFVDNVDDDDDDTVEVEYVEKVEVVDSGNPLVVVVVELGVVVDVVVVVDESDSVVDVNGIIEKSGVYISICTPEDPPLFPSTAYIKNSSETKKGKSRIQDMLAFEVIIDKLKSTK